MTSTSVKHEIFCPVKVGSKYLHYKTGTQYLILAIATHTETEETMIVYRAWRGMHHPVWVRPLGVFTSLAMQEGKAVPRFTLVE